jgi:hypothetical protein
MLKPVGINSCNSADVHRYRVLHLPGLHDELTLLISKEQERKHREGKCSISEYVCRQIGGRWKACVCALQI